MYYKVTAGRVAQLSVQQLISCDTGNQGCNGGNYDASLRYVRDTGLVPASDFPYDGQVQSCPFPTPKPFNPLLKFTAFNRQLPASEDALMEFLVQGPIAVGLIVVEDMFWYAGGVFNSTNCTNRPISHGMIIVSAGNDVISGQPFWVLRNSWGSNWGEGGYIRMVRNANPSQFPFGMCAITQYAWTAEGEL
jgi:hypothetical protein